MILTISSDGNRGHIIKAVILAGGLGTRISEETQTRPKPMVEIGHRPLLWHIMKTYTHYNVTDFIICCGYKGFVIKEFFHNYHIHTSDITLDLRAGRMEIHHKTTEPWRITLVDTGDETNTGGRLKRVHSYLAEDEEFFFTYGDGLADIDISKLLSFHKSTNKLVTVTAVQPPGRFGALGLMGDSVARFEEKPQGDGGWINGGYFVINKRALQYIDNDTDAWEKAPLERLASNGEVCAYKHTGFWQPMDTLRDKVHLEKLWDRGEAPWKVWR